MPSSSLSTPRERDSHVSSLEIFLLRTMTRWTFRFRNSTIIFSIMCYNVPLIKILKFRRRHYDANPRGKSVSLENANIDRNKFPSPDFLCFSRLNVEKNALVAPDSVVFGYFHCTTWDTSLSLGSIRNRATFANAIGMIELLRMRDRI